MRTSDKDAAVEKLQFFTADMVGSMLPVFVQVVIVFLFCAYIFTSTDYTVIAGHLGQVLSSGSLTMSCAILLANPFFRCISRANGNFSEIRFQGHPGTLLLLIVVYTILVAIGPISFIIFALNVANVWQGLWVVIALNVVAVLATAWVVSHNLSEEVSRCGHVGSPYSQDVQRAVRVIHSFFRRFK